MANTRKAGNDQRINESQSQDNLRTQRNAEQMDQAQEISNLRNQGIPQRGSAQNSEKGSQKKGGKQHTGNNPGNSYVQSGSSIKRGSERDRDRSSSGLKSTTLDGSTQGMSGQTFSDESGREEQSDR